MKNKLPLATDSPSTMSWVDYYKNIGKSIIAVGNNPRVSGQTLTNIRAYLLKTGQIEKS